MAQNQTTTLSDLDAYLQGETLVFLATVDADTQTPSISAISWVKKKDDNTLRFSVASQSRIIENLKANPRVTLSLIGLESVYSIVGSCEILEEKMEAIAIKLAKIEVKVDNVFNSMFWGSKITQEPVYEKTYDKEKAQKLDNEVYEELMK
ncbi:pyridoxamine 5'-phosphate oxidase family protein [Ammoniphilus sp. YIM 78166]|uniref:pyridoxamine 5'-phosphate oxidase family protein n=1 Tax=Ammoniphilus sp. YIM 78166 TaxID=1644106 RepID=UPI00106F743A|nr:pyridoxamine 5'-phosphate oxidase family protein [Ammoniphilus sp. YIM 78166]